MRKRIGTKSAVSACRKAFGSPVREIGSPTVSRITNSSACIGSDWAGAAISSIRSGSMKQRQKIRFRGRNGVDPFCGQKSDGGGVPVAISRKAENPHTRRAGEHGRGLKRSAGAVAMAGQDLHVEQTAKQRRAVGARPVQKSLPPDRGRRFPEADPPVRSGNPRQRRVAVAFRSTASADRAPEPPGAEPGAVCAKVRPPPRRPYCPTWSPGNPLIWGVSTPIPALLGPPMASSRTGPTESAGRIWVPVSRRLSVSQGMALAGSASTPARNHTVRCNRKERCRHSATPVHLQPRSTEIGRTTSPVGAGRSPMSA